MSAIGLPHARGCAISVYADWRHDHLVFERQQSVELRAMSWEGRIKPLTPWGTLLARAAVVVMLAAIILAILI